jgi:hypothetical protein
LDSAEILKIVRQRSSVGLTTRASAAGPKAAPAKSTHHSGCGPPTPRQEQALVRQQPRLVTGPVRHKPGPRKGRLVGNGFLKVACVTLEDQSDPEAFAGAHRNCGMKWAITDCPRPDFKTSSRQPSHTIYTNRQIGIRGISAGAVTTNQNGNLAALDFRPRRVLEPDVQLRASDTRRQSGAMHDNGVPRRVR